MSAQQIAEMHAALSALGEHTFRYGGVLATISGFEASDRMLTINSISGSFLTIPAVLDPPLHFVDAEHNGDPLDSAYGMIADVVRRFAG